MIIPNTEIDNFKALSCSENKNLNKDPNGNQLMDVDNKNRFSEQSTPTQKIFDHFVIKGIQIIVREN